MKLNCYQNQFILMPWKLSAMNTYLVFLTHALLAHYWRLMTNCTSLWYWQFFFNIGHKQRLLILAQWFRGRASDSRIRGPRFESCVAMWNLGLVFHTALLHFTQLYEWVPVYKQWRTLCKQSSQNCHVAECFPEKPIWSSIERVCQGVKCKRRFTYKLDTVAYINLL